MVVIGKWKNGNTNVNSVWRRKMFEDIWPESSPLDDCILHCAGGCGKTVKLNSKSQVEMITWTCTECVDKRFGDV